MMSMSLQDALESRASRTLHPIAGGTDWYPSLQDAAAPDNVLHLAGIAELHGIECGDARWRIGSAATWTDFINADLPAAFDCIKQAGREVGSVQIQNTATLAGNVCNASPAADGVPALMALDASVELQSVRGMRMLRLDEFILGVRKTAMEPDELMTAIVLPVPEATARSVFYKLGSRTYLVISIAMLAVCLCVEEKGTITSAGIAVGACSPVARRLPDLEHALVGRTVQDKSLGSLVRADHLKVLSPIDDVRGTAQYRLAAVKVMLERALDNLSRQYAHG